MGKKGNIWRRLVILAIFAWVLISGLYLAWKDSMTSDEGIHVASGYLALTRGDFRYDPEHPFLFKTLTALPLLVYRPNLPKEDKLLWDRSEPTFYDSWRESREWSDLWFYRSGNNAQMMLFLARLPAILVLLVFCWLVYYLATLWFSAEVGVLALLLISFNPTVLAHGHLTNTDVPVALSILTFTYVLWLYLRKPSLKYAVLLGLVFALAQLVKFSAIGLALVIPIALLYQIYKFKRYKDTFIHVGIILAVTWFIIWGAYLFKSPLIIDGHTTDVSSFLQNHSDLSKIQVEKISRILRYILPSPYLKGFIMVQISALYGRGAYILERTYYPNVWFYFPVLYMLKTQIAALLILVIGLVSLLIRKLKGLPLIEHRLAYLTLLMVGTVYAALTVASKLNLGIRHIMPLMPIVTLFMAWALHKVLQKSRVLAGILLAGYMVPVLWQYPHLISYTNFFVRPYQKAYRYMNDSNLDWGQQVGYAADYIKQYYSSEKIYTNFPWNEYAFAYYGIKTTKFDPLNIPNDGVIMLTATQLSDVEYRLFRDYKPAGSVGNHTFFYRF